MDASSEAILTVNKKGKITRANPQASHLFGYRIDDFINRPFESLLPEQFHQQYLNFRQNYIKHPKIIRLMETTNLEISTKSAQQIPVEIVLTPLETNGNNALYTIIDISERKAYENMLAQESKKIQLLYKTSTILSEIDDVKEAMKVCLDLICISIQWPIGHIFILTKNERPYLSSSDIWYIDNEENTADFKRISEQTKFYKGVGLPGKIWELSKPVWLSNIFKDNKYPRATEGRKLGLRSIVGFPILVKKEVVAVFEFFSFELLSEDLDLLRIFEVMSEQMGRIFERKIAQQQLEHTANELKHSNSSLVFLAHHDFLTGVANRAQFEKLANESILRAQRYQKRMAIIILDLDQFKSINDSLGHAVGDQILKKVVERLQPEIRKVDTIARLGGDEFAIILDSIEEADSQLFVKKIIELLRLPFQVLGYQIFVTASMGIVMYPSCGNNLDVLLKNADIALYKAKKDGKNRFSNFSAELNAQMRKKTEIEKCIRNALQEKKFNLRYQPIY